MAMTMTASTTRTTRTTTRTKINTTTRKNNKNKNNRTHEVLLNLLLVAAAFFVSSSIVSFSNNNDDGPRRDGSVKFMMTVEAWASTTTVATKTKTGRRTSASAASTRLYYAAPTTSKKNKIVNDHKNDEEEQEDGTGCSTSSSSSSSSRRRWFRQVGRLATAGSATAAAAIGFGSHPVPASAEAGAATLPEAIEITTSTRQQSDPPPPPPQSSSSKKAPQLVSSEAVCDSSVSVWKNPEGRIVYLLGTAHVSKLSAELAGRLVKDTSPNGVFVELDPKRLKPGSGVLASKVSTEGKKESKIIVPQIQMVSSSTGAVAAAVGGGGGGGSGETGSSTSVASSSALPSSSTPPKSNNNPIMRAAAAAVGNSIKGMYKQLDSAGFESGEEFVVAIREGQKLGSDIVLGDRDVEVTLRRLTEGLAKTDIKALLSPDAELEQSLQALVPPSTSKVLSNKMAAGTEQNDDEQFREEFSSFVEVMKTKENVKMIMGQLQRVAPFLYEALVSERDAYMAAGLNGLNELTSIVAVVGIAHVDGIETNLSLNGWTQMSPSCSKFR
mmetsp:Transcript_34518/g.83302  ORF Transcript_34518/g.83302 Transcript_34518/m.83302 type:complete len:554 (+) Transcript_34518:109-1770(+)